MKPHRDSAPSGVGGSILARIVGLVIVGGVGWLVAGPFGTIVVIAVVAGAPSIRRRRQWRLERRRVGGDIAEVFEIAARSVRSGMSPVEAVTQASLESPAAGGRIVAEMMGRGSIGGGPRRGAEARPLGVSDLPGATRDVVAVVIDLVRGTSGGGARGLDAGAALLRDHDRVRGEVLAASAHARASARLLVVLPVVFALASFTLLGSSDVRGGSTGLIATAVGVGLAFEVAGAWWAHRLIRAATGGMP